MSPFALLVSLLLATDEPAQIAREAKRQAAEDLRVLQAARVPTDGPALVQFLRKQIITPADEKRVRELLRQLTSRTFRVRDQASRELTSRGPAVLPLLRRAPKGIDLEAQRRLQRCIETVEKISWSTVGTAAARRLKTLHPTGACAALLAYLPFAGEEAEEEIVTALLAVGVRDGKPNPVFASALRDPAPSRRGASALVLGWHGDARQRVAVRQVMHNDLYFSVRLRAAEGLLEAGDASPVPVLLAVLAEGSPELARRAEDLLQCAAEPSSPAVALGPDPADRRKAHDAWQLWWEARNGKLDLRVGAVLALRANPRQLARKTAERFLHAVIASHSRAELRKAIGLPFAIKGIKTYKTWVEVDAAFKDELQSNANEQQKALKITVKQVLQLSEYEKNLPTDDGGTREFLRALRGQQILVVRVELTVRKGTSGEFDAYTLYIRIRGGGARVVALSD